MLTAVEQLPVVEHALGECLATGRGAQFTVEAERLHDGKVSLDGEHRSSDPLLFAEDLATSPVEDGVDTADSLFWALDLDWRQTLHQRRIQFRYICDIPR